MCGIVGYAGPKSIDPFLVVSLKKLEYRGYDSAGIAVIDKGELVIRKKAGKIGELEEELKKDKIYGNVGIGHTRWATHGEATTANAHPHVNGSQTIAVVHNGIIENFLEIKKKLAHDGIIFSSDTDTEVIPHLVDLNYNKNGDIQKAFTDTIHSLEGKYSIAMISEAQPDRIYFARNGAPLMIARTAETGECFLASDLPAVVPVATESYFLHDMQWGFMEKGEIQVFNWENSPIGITFDKIEMKLADIDKGDYPHYMLKEIYEQPELIRNIIAQRIKDGKLHFPELSIDQEYLKNVDRIVIQASGTSLIAGRAGKLYFEQYSRIYTEADYSSEFRYRNPLIEGNTLVIGISQSGETADTIAGIHEAKAKFLKVVSFVNNLNSTMARESNGIIDIMAGPEIGVASTKAYTAQLLNLYLFSLHLGELKGFLSSEDIKVNLEKLEGLASKIETLLNNVNQIQNVANYLKEQSDTIFLGRTYNYPSALEGALKLKEISYIHASGYAAGEFKHGPIALVSEGLPVIIIAPKSETRTKILSNLLEVKSRKGKIISIISEGDTEIGDQSDFVIEIPDIEESLSPLLTIIPLQLLAYYTALYRDCNVDKPRNLAKSVTVE